METFRRLRVFAPAGHSREGGGGNPLAVIRVDESGVEEAEMQRIASDIGYSETVFVYDTDPLSIRIFTPTTELDFAGHPVVGAAWYGSREIGRKIESISTRSGEVAARVTGRHAYFTATLPSVSHLPGEAIFEILGALGCEVMDLTPRIAPATVEMGLSHLILPFAEPDRVLELEPDLPRLAALDSLRGGLYVFAMRKGDVTARSFAPRIGVDEDPGTGSGALALAAYLARHRTRLRVPSSFDVFQGAAMGVPCRISVAYRDGGAEVGGLVADDGKLPVPRGSAGMR